MLKITCLVFISVIYSMVNAQAQLTCPPPTLVPVCKITCTSDSECGDVDDMCCPTACGGSLCQRAVTQKVREQAIKPGSCPRSPGGHWICSNMCNTDSDCSRKDKCCPNRCGAMVCQKPEPPSENEIPSLY